MLNTVFSQVADIVFIPNEKIPPLASKACH